jgi:hypothetical protein
MEGCDGLDSLFLARSHRAQPARRTARNPQDAPLTSAGMTWDDADG